MQRKLDCGAWESDSSTPCHPKLRRRTFDASLQAGYSQVPLLFFFGHSILVPLSQVIVQPVGVPAPAQHSGLQHWLRELQQSAASADALIASPANINAEKSSTRISEVVFFIFIPPRAKT
jgi:hypothetical protein